tara:strand:+ start:141 stop:1448 length:1308 start_codon:yes stop_codon:yes gene_type:complete
MPTCSSPPATARHQRSNPHQQLEAAIEQTAAVQRELVSSKSALGAMRMSRDSLRAKLQTYEEAESQKTRVTDRSTAMLRAKLEQCQKMLTHMEAQAGDTAADGAQLRAEVSRLDEELRTERFKLDQARSALLAKEQQVTELLNLRTADAAAAKAATRRASEACSERDQSAQRAEELWQRLNAQERVAAEREQAAERKEAQLKAKLESQTRQINVLKGQLDRATTEADRAAAEEKRAREQAMKAARGHKRASEESGARLDAVRAAQQQLQQQVDAAGDTEAEAMRQQSEWRAMFNQASAREAQLRAELQHSKEHRARLEGMLGGVHEQMRKQERELTERRHLCAQLEHNIMQTPSAQQIADAADAANATEPPQLLADAGSNGGSIAASKGPTPASSPPSTNNPKEMLGRSGSSTAVAVPRYQQSKSKQRHTPRNRM